MKKEQSAIIFANISAILLVIIKTFAGIFTGSVAILSSALDSMLDFIVSVINLYILKKSDTPTDKEFNYGRGKLQGIGAMLEGVIIFVSASIVIYLGIYKIIEAESVGQIDLSIYIMIVSIFITGSLVWYLKKVYRETNNLVIKADLLHYNSDLITNAGIIFSLILIKFTSLYFLDGLISIIISSYILKGSWEIIKEGFDMLMDKSIENEETIKIKEIITDSSSLVTGYHFLRTRRSGKIVFVEFHLVFNSDIKLHDAHFIGENIEKKIKELFDFCIVTIHFDTYDDSEIESSNLKYNYFSD